MSNSSEVKIKDTVPVECGNYTFLEDQNGVKEDLNKQIVIVQDLLQSVYKAAVMKGKCRVLLHRFGYKMKDLEQAIGRTKTMEKLFRKFCSLICIPDTSYKDPELCDSNEMCQFCRLMSTKKLSCGHIACPKDWWLHFAGIIGRNRLVVTCFDFNCKEVIYDEMVEEIIRMTAQNDDNVLKERLAAFDDWKVKTYFTLTTKFHKTIVMCPKKKCGKYVKLPDRNPRRIRCPCKHKFIVNKCCDEWHAPVPCQLWQMWKQYCPEHQIPKWDESLEWLSEYAMRCPNPECSKLIMRDGGCRGMRCICRQVFFWRSPQHQDVPFSRLSRLFLGEGYCEQFNAIQNYRNSWKPMEEMKKQATKNGEVLIEKKIKTSQYIQSTISDIHEGSLRMPRKTDSPQSILLLH